MNSTTKTAPTGCYVDSHHGHYAIPAAIHVAHDFGFPLTELDHYLLITYEQNYHQEWYPQESLIGLLDDAEAWLNSNVAGEHGGTYWGWNDGDFGLYQDEDDD